MSERGNLQPAAELLVSEENRKDCMKKAYTVQVAEIDGRWSAVCPELCVSGFGRSRKKAMDALLRSMSSTLRAMALALVRDRTMITQMATIKR